MANVEHLAPLILKWEGRFVNDPLDHGGATNKGVTIATYRQVYGQYKTVEDLKKMSSEEFNYILKQFYWDRWQADQILNQSIANILVDWVWGSGKWGITIPQRLLGVIPDGKVGAITLDALNRHCKECFFNDLVQARVNFLNDIVKRDPSQKRFFNGWMNRLEDFKFCPSIQ